MSFIWLSVFGSFASLSFKNGFAGSCSNCLVLLKHLWHSDSTVLRSDRQCHIVLSFPTYWPGSSYLCCVCVCGGGRCRFVLFWFLLDSPLMDVEFCFIAMSWILTPYQKDDLHIVSPILWVDSSLFADSVLWYTSFFILIQFSLFLLLPVLMWEGVTISFTSTVVGLQMSWECIRNFSSPQWSSHFLDFKFFILKLNFYQWSRIFQLIFLIFFWEHVYWFLLVLNKRYLFDILFK